MPRIAQDSLWSLERYHKERPAFRARVIAHKKARTLHLGEHLTLLFEDELTIRYQVQEMLRVERIFEDEAIRDELATYNPLVPDGRNWKATLLIEYAEVAERQRMLGLLKGVEQCVYVKIAGHAPVLPIADEDLERENDEKTSSVHFLRFELSDTLAEALETGAGLSAGVEHPHYRARVSPLPDTLRAALIADLA